MLYSALLSAPCGAFIVSKLFSKHKAVISTHFCAVWHPKISILTTIFGEVDFGLTPAGMEPLRVQNRKSAEGF